MDELPKALKPDKRYEANLHRYQRYKSVMMTGDRLLRPPAGTRHPVTGEALPWGTYLRRLPGEKVRPNGVNPFYERLKSAAHIPVSEEVIGVYVDTLFRQMIDRAEVFRVLGPTAIPDVDLRCSSVDDWLAQVYSWGLSQGWLLGLVDAPRITPDEYPSQAHVDAAGLRPWVRIYLPERIWQLEQGSQGNLLHVLARETEKRWGDWRPDRYQALDEKGEPLGDPVPIDGIPMEMFVASDPDPDSDEAPPGESAIRSISLIDLQILQHHSLLDDLIVKTAFALLHMKGDSLEDEPASTQQLGNDFMLEYDGEANWIAPPPELAASIREHIDWLASQAYKMGGVHRRSQESVEAHSGLALDWESAPIYATVARWARRLQDWETRIWKRVATVMWRDPSGIAVVYPDDFSSRPVDEDLSQAEAITKVYGGYSNAPDDVKAGINAKVRRAIQRDVGHIRAVQEALAKAARPPKIEGNGGTNE